MCETKRRYLCQDEKANKTGFWIFQKFWDMNYRSKRTRTYADFVGSNLYKVLVAFGKYIQDINAVRPEYFVEFLLKGEVAVDRWMSPVIYESYIRELNKKESPSAALERNFLLMEQWASTSGEDWTDFFRKVPCPLATSWIISGRVSPWVLYVAPSAAMLLDRMSEEQLTLIQKNVEPKFWAVKLEKHAAEVDVMRDELTAAGL